MSSMVRRRPSPRLARRLALGLAGARLALGVVAVVAPDQPTRPWIGRVGEGPTRRVLARALGGRDLALGIGALAAARNGADLRIWVAAAGLADAGDVVATLLAFPHLPKVGRLVVLAAAGGSALVAAGTVAAL